VKDAQGDPAYGRTNWRRFAVAVGVPTVVAGALVVGLANGAFAASLTLSGQAFKIKADRLEATGFVQYSQGYAQGGKNADKPLGLAVSGIKDAQLYNLCQSVHPDGLPFSLVITAGKEDKHPALAHNMLIGMTHLQGEAVFHGIEIGKDASTVSKGSDDGSAKGAAGTFARGRQRHDHRPGTDRAVHRGGTVHAHRTGPQREHRLERAPERVFLT